MQQKIWNAILLHAWKMALCSLRQRIALESHICHAFSTLQSPACLWHALQLVSPVLGCRQTRAMFQMLLAVQYRLVKFTNVSKLSIFIEDNQEEEETTRIQKIMLYGSAGQTMNVNEIKKVGEEQG